ncbi:MAG: hypothetical protein FDZ69_07445 [Deltaproteobacteria bacterium]|nr:MAG: hypothetical protein FDZ69_07445 [Deltaproteobacteria bacterium]
MDISALKKDRLEVWVQFTPDVRLKLRYIPRDELQRLAKAATVVELDPKSRQKVETFDGLKSDVLLCQAAVVDYTGLEMDGQPFPCTPENIELLASKWTGFASFVARVCIDLEEMQRSDLEAVEKN